MSWERAFKTKRHKFISLHDCCLSACIRSLLNLTGEDSFEVSRHLISQLSSHHYAAFTAPILQIIIERYPRYLTNELLSVLLPPNTRVLNLKKCSYVSVDGIFSALSSAKAIDGLDLTECSHLTLPSFFFHLAKRTSLSSLNLELCESVNDDCVKVIFEEMPLLKKLNISMCNQITHNVFLLGALPIDFIKGDVSWKEARARLRSLNLSGCHSIEDVSIGHLALLCGETLEELDLSFTKVSASSLLFLAGFNSDSVTSIIDHRMELNDEQMEQLFVQKTSSSVQSTVDGDIHVCEPTEETNDKIWKLRNHWSQSYSPVLRSLNLNHIPISAGGWEIYFKMLFIANRQLERFTTSFISDDLVGFMSHCMENLTHLTIEECQLIREEESFSALVSCCVNLRHLNLRGSCFISSQALVPLIKRGDLESLNLAELHVTDTFLTLVSSHCKKLKLLNISWCEEVTSKGLEKLVNSCTDLRTFDLRMCPVSPNFIQHLVNNCTQITHLDIAHAEDGSFRSYYLSIIAFTMTSLEYLDVSWNSEITTAEVMALLSNCIKLKTLKLAGVKLLTSECFLPIIPDWHEFFKMLTAMSVHKHERANNPDGDSTDEELDDICMVHRSTVFAPALQFLDLEYVDLVKDHHLSAIVAVCHGTLQIKDYYSDDIQPLLFTPSFKKLGFK